MTTYVWVTKMCYFVLSKNLPNQAYQNYGVVRFPKFSQTNVGAQFYVAEIVTSGVFSHLRERVDTVLNLRVIGRYSISNQAERNRKTFVDVHHCIRRLNKMK